MQWNRPYIFAGLVLLVLGLFVTPGVAQRNNEVWLRVLTGDDVIIDVRRASLALEQQQVFSAEFRTTLTTTEPLPGGGNGAYQTRLDKIQFDIEKWRYRIVESSFFDVSQKPLLSTHSENWMPRGGRTAHRLFSAASQLAPFGTWNVKSYRYASGENPAPDDPAELKQLLGTRVSLRWDRFQVGDQTCSAPVFEPKTISSEEVFTKAGITLQELGVTTPKLNVIIVRCPADSKFPVQTMILQQNAKKALVLWEGVFFEIERPGNPFLTY